MAKTILVIEDDLEIRQTLVDVLNDEGYDVVASENGQRGLEILQTSDELPCLIIVDWMMPVMDGDSFRREQMRDQRFSKVPTVLFSANGRVSQKANDAGYSEYLKKPIDLEQLFELAVRYCK